MTELLTFLVIPANILLSIVTWQSGHGNPLESLNRGLSPGTMLSVVLRLCRYRLTLLNPMTTDNNNSHIPMVCVCIVMRIERALVVQCHVICIECQGPGGR